VKYLTLQNLVDAGACESGVEEASKALGVLDYDTPIEVTKERCLALYDKVDFEWALSNLLPWSSTVAARQKMHAVTDPLQAAVNAAWKQSMAKSSEEAWAAYISAKELARSAQLRETAIAFAEAFLAHPEDQPLVQVVPDEDDDYDDEEDHEGDTDENSVIII
jgi:hypothetical protein